MNRRKNRARLTAKKEKVHGTRCDKNITSNESIYNSIGKKVIDFRSRMLEIVVTIIEKWYKIGSASVSCLSAYERTVHVFQ